MNLSDDGVGNTLVSAARLGFYDSEHSGPAEGDRLSLQPGYKIKIDLSPKMARGLEEAHRELTDTILACRPLVNAVDRTRIYQGIADTIVQLLPAFTPISIGDIGGRHD